MNNTTLLVIAVVLVAGGAYWYLSTGTGNQPPLTATVAENVVQTQFQTLASGLESISFDTKIFSDSRFTLLVDLKTPVTPESSGRLDPFAALSGAGR